MSAGRDASRIRSLMISIKTEDNSSSVRSPGPSSARHCARIGSQVRMAAGDTEVVKKASTI